MLKHVALRVSCRLVARCPVDVLDTGLALYCSFGAVASAAVRLKGLALCSGYLCFPLLLKPFYGFHTGWINDDLTAS